MPDSYGKRQRDAVKARKAAAREDRRVARRQRQNDRGNEPLGDGIVDVQIEGIEGIEGESMPGLVSDQPATDGAIDAALPVMSQTDIRKEGP